MLKLEHSFDRELPHSVKLNGGGENGQVLFNVTNPMRVIKI